MKNLNSKLVVVTGASSGIGEAVALEAAQKGARLVLVARDENRLAAVASRIQKAGGEAGVFPADLSDPKAVEHMAAQVRRQMGATDVLVNNAGAGKWLYLDETSAETAQSMLALPVLAAVNTTRTFLPDMLRKDRGRVVNVTSVGGFMAWPGATVYTSARWAMRGFSEALAADLSRTGVAVTLAAFAKVDSPYFTKNLGSAERIPSAQKMIRVLTSAEAGRAIVQGIVRGKSTVVAPFMLRMVLFQARYFPGTTRQLMQATGHRRVA